MRHRPRFPFDHWRAKLGSLFLATVVWLVIKHGIAYTPSLAAPVPPPPTPPLVGTPSGAHA